MNFSDKEQSARVRHEPAHRLRVGMTGLAVVILIIALATAIASGVRRNALSEAPAVPPLAGATTPGMVPNAAAPTEPLAELGVAPGGQDANEQVPATAVHRTEATARPAQPPAPAAHP